MSWIDRFSGLARLPEPLRRGLEESARLVRFAPGARLFTPGQPPDTMLMLVEGSIRVQQVSESGREIVLYRVHAGDSCVMTTCLMARQAHAAEGIAETEVTVAALPHAVFDRLLAGSSDFRGMVLDAYAQRMLDLCAVIEEVAFRRIDIRLAQRLTALAGAETSLRSTHQQLATELGTAREVISRQLQEFQRRGWITQTRGTIALNDRAALDHLAGTNA